MQSFGTVIQEHAAPSAEALVSTTVLDRFRDVLAYATSTMPTVALGHTYTFDGDEVLTITEVDGKVAVYDPKTRDVDWLHRRAFAEYGTHVGKASSASLSVPLMALSLAQACDIPLGTTEIETVEAIVAVIGVEATEDYLDALCDDGGEAAAQMYADGDLDELLADAALFAYETNLSEE